MGKSNFSKLWTAFLIGWAITVGLGILTGVGMFIAVMKFLDWLSTL